VVLEADPAAARATARQYTTGYLTLPNYTNNLRRFGWTDEDFADGGSDRLVDALIPWGTAEQVAAGIEKHFQAGADEVAIQVLNGGDATTFPRRGVPSPGRGPDLSVQESGLRKRCGRDVEPGAAAPSQRSDEDAGDRRS
jgi:alkanesulfonate monooxygenase SsuD/methylene tetrahydromethanopterin reductase-like flavin-dependent oxidoreductase (luciferase family)